jgi:hypothetical protein
MEALPSRTERLEQPAQPTPRPTLRRLLNCQRGEGERLAAAKLLAELVKR